MSGRQVDLEEPERDEDGLNIRLREQFAVPWQDYLVPGVVCVSAEA
jgi:hypothetical protein